MTARGPELRAKAAGLGSLPGEMGEKLAFSLIVTATRPPAPPSPCPAAMPILSMLAWSTLTHSPHP